MDGAGTQTGSNLSLRTPQKSVAAVTGGGAGETHNKTTTATTVVANHVPVVPAQTPTTPQLSSRAPTKYPSAAAGSQKPTPRRPSVGGENGDAANNGGTPSATAGGHVKRPQTATVTSADQTKESLLSRPKTLTGGTTVSNSTTPTAGDSVTDSPKVFECVIWFSPTFLFELT